MPKPVAWMLVIFSKFIPLEYTQPGHAVFIDAVVCLEQKITN